MRLLGLLALLPSVALAQGAVTPLSQNVPDTLGPTTVNGNLSVNGDAGFNNVLAAALNATAVNGAVVDAGGLLVTGDSISFCNVSDNGCSVVFNYASGTVTPITNGTTAGFGWTAGQPYINGNPTIAGTTMSFGGASGLIQSANGTNLTLQAGSTGASTLVLNGASGSTTLNGTISYFKGGDEVQFFGDFGLTLAAAVRAGGWGLPGCNSVGTARAFTLTAATGDVTIASGGGAATTVLTTTDGTNTCTFTIPCNSAPPAGTNATGTVRIAGVNGAGTGCAYPAGACITASVTTAGCTATQPTINLRYNGTWQ